LTEDYFDFDLYEIPISTEVGDTEAGVSDNMVFIYREDFTAHEGLFGKIFAAAGLDQGRNLHVIQLNKGEHINIGSKVSATTKQIIAFGIAPDKLGLNAKFRGYHNYTTETFKLLLSHSLKKLQESKEHKKALWEVLKAIYL